MKALAFIIAVIAVACFIGAIVSTVAVILKICGCGLVAGVSGWLPFQFVGGLIVSWVVCVLVKWPSGLRNI
jgi:hypothetical protein